MNITKKIGKHKYKLECYTHGVWYNIYVKRGLFWFKWNSGHVDRHEYKDSITEFVARMKNYVEEKIETEERNLRELEQAVSMDKIELLDKIKNYDK